MDKQPEVEIIIQTTDNGFFVRERYPDEVNCRVATDKETLKSAVITIFDSAFCRKVEEGKDKKTTKLHS